LADLACCFICDGQKENETAGNCTVAVAAPALPDTRIAIRACRHVERVSVQHSSVLAQNGNCVVMRHFTSPFTKTAAYTAACCGYGNKLGRGTFSFCVRDNKGPKRVCFAEMYLFSLMS